MTRKGHDGDDAPIGGLAKREAVGRAANTLLGLALLSVSTRSWSEEGSVAETSQAITDARIDEETSSVVAIGRLGQVVCSGTAVGPRSVLTAAHCFTDDPVEFFSVASSSDPASSPLVGLDAVAVHPAFDPILLANDVAVVSTTTDLGVAWATIERASSDLDGASVRVVGFGRTGTEPHRRRSALATVIEAGPNELTLGGRSHACHGDSGGPTILDATGQPLVVGVISHGDEACRAHSTSVRTSSVATFLSVTVPDASAYENPSDGGCSTKRTQPTRAGFAGFTAFALAVAALARRRSRREVSAA